MKLKPILKSLALGFLLATVAFMFLVRVDEDLATLAFVLLWPLFSIGLWVIVRRQRVAPEATTAPIKPKTQSASGKRLFITAVLAIVMPAILALAINTDVVGISFIPLWLVLYYGWPYLSRRVPFLDFDKPSTTPAPKRALGLRLIRGALATVGAVFVALIVLLLGAVVVPISLCEHRAQKVANSIHIGMTVQEVLDTAKDCDSFHAGSDFPWDKNAPGDNIPAMGLSWRRNGTYVTYDLTAGQDLLLTESEAIQRLHTKLHDGYKWYFSYTYTNITPMHVSFRVVFGPDGRVAEVTPVHGWD